MMSQHDVEIAEARQLHGLRVEARQVANGTIHKAIPREGARDRRVHFPDGSVLTDTGHSSRFVDRRSPEDLME